jgi:hypothetical protein
VLLDLPGQSARSASPVLPALQEQSALPAPPELSVLPAHPEWQAPLEQLDLPGQSVRRDQRARWALLVPLVLRELLERWGRSDCKGPRD